MAARRTSKPTPATYGHDHASRKNTPTEQTAEMVDDDTREARPFEPDIRAQDDQPRLNWQRVGPAETHDSYPMYVREKLRPGHFATWLQEGQRDEEEHADSMFRSQFNGLPTTDSKYEWYQHDANWSNRIIHGESVQVMTSLLEREQMAGKVQMIYMDPPYGMKFKSWFQVDATDMNVGEKKSDISDVQTSRAFGDSHHRGIHSYLDETMKQLRLCRDLLADTGSMFFQIGDENVHRVAMLMDEVFGAENRVATISFVTTGSSSSTMLPSVADCLMWYAKDVESAKEKFNQLYQERDTDEMLARDRGYSSVEFASGVSRYLTSAERAGAWRDFEQPFRLFSAMPVMSMGYSAPATDNHGCPGRSEPYELQENVTLRRVGRSIPCPPGKQWSVCHWGLDNIDAKGRLFVQGDGDDLRYKQYYDERPGRKLHNIWYDPASERNKRYVVQTAEKVIRRAMLMTTEPGDLVFDPTCGSGTTARVAEEWGRRWITCDCAPTAVTLARQRIATGVYSYWALKNTKEGSAEESNIIERLHRELKLKVRPEFELTTADSHDPSNGFVYQRVPYVSAKTLAYDLDQTYTYLVDQPAKVKGKVRLASPFTVESTAGAGFQPFKPTGTGSRHTDSKKHADYATRVHDLLINAEVADSINASTFDFVELTPLAKTTYIAYRATYETEGERHEGGLMLAPPDAVVPREAIQKAAREVAKHIASDAVLFVVAYEAQTGSQQLDGERDRVGHVRVHHVRPHRDLDRYDLNSEDGHRAFAVLAEPDILIYKSPGDDGRIEVELRGFDTYDPKTGETHHMAAEKDVACWMIDTNFDETSFFATRLHFPANGEPDLRKLARALKVDVESVRYQSTLSNRSAPFKVGANNAIAVRVVTRTGDEMTHEILDPVSQAVGTAKNTWEGWTERTQESSSNTTWTASRQDEEGYRHLWLWLQRSKTLMFSVDGQPANDSPLVGAGRTQNPEAFERVSQKQHSLSPSEWERMSQEELINHCSFLQFVVEFDIETLAVARERAMQYTQRWSQ